jgi:hypothetical protein
LAMDSRANLPAEWHARLGRQGRSATGGVRLPWLRI